MERNTAALNQRKPWLDGCRALAMILVIYGHIDRQTTAIASLIVPVKIPLFFAITGYLMNARKSPRDFFRRLLTGLVLPWLFFAYVQSIVANMILGSSSLLQVTWDIISGNVLWYMPCCILAEILFYMLNRYIKDRKWLVAACILAFCAGYGLSRFGLGNPFAFNVVLIAQFYMLLGQIYKWSEPKLAAFAPKPRTILIAVLGAIYLVLATVNTLLYPVQHIDIHTNVYNCLPLTLSMIYIGCFLAFTISQLIKVPGWLVFIGQNTLVYYMLHGRFITLFKLLFSRFHIPVSNVVLVSISVTALVCICLMFCAGFINRYLPAIAGKRHKKSTA